MVISSFAWNDPASCYWQWVRIVVLMLNVATKLGLEEAMYCVTTQMRVPTPLEASEMFCPIICIWPDCRWALQWMHGCRPAPCSIPAG